MLNDQQLQARIDNFLHRKETQYSNLKGTKRRIEWRKASSTTSPRAGAWATQ